jgi:hypothetical protein
MTFRIGSKSRGRLYGHQDRIVTNADELQDAVKHGDAHITVKGKIRRKNSNQIFVRKNQK